MASATAIDDLLDDAELWNAIESAAASSRLRKGLPPTPQPRLPPPSPAPSHQFAYRNPCRPRPKAQSDEAGEVVQPEKKPRIAVQESIDRRIVIAQNQNGTNVTPKQVYPDPNPMMYQSPVKNRVVVSEVSPVVESPSPATERKLGSRHSLLIGEFPSVATFKHFQDMALEILEKSDYTMICGNPYIKKSGWRKMSFFFNISYEIRDKTIEFDENRNVRRAEFVVRAHMHLLYTNIFKNFRKEVGGSLMGGVHARRVRKGLTSQTTTYLALLKPGPKIKLVRIFLELGMAASTD